MARWKGDAAVLRVVVRFLRAHARMTQMEFARKSRVDQPQLSRYERGETIPPEPALRRMAAAAGLEWTAVLHLRRFYAAVLAAQARREATFAVPDPELEKALLDAVLLAVTPYLIEKGVDEPLPQSPEEARREADEVWANLKRLPVAESRRLLGCAPRASGNWALAVEACLESERRAAHSAQEALELAELALFIAERVVSDEGFRAALQALCWAVLGNAHRVANDFGAADTAFARSADFAQAGADPAGLLPTWRVLDLEASLRREQHRFADALELLEQAQAHCKGDPPAAGRILLKKEHVLAQQGDFEGALAALNEAAPWLENTREPRLLAVHRFNTVDILCRLDRFQEAWPLLPQVRELVNELCNELDLIRVTWLEAKAMAGLGQKPAAMARLEQVQKAFTAEELPYDAALASLDLAVLWLEAGRRAEVRELAVGMQWIFRAQGIEREALAALKLFCDAAKEDAATVELARQAIRGIEKARHSAPARS